MNREEMLAYAEGYQTENSDGNPLHHFPPIEGDWRIERIPAAEVIVRLPVFESPEIAYKYIADEIAMRRADGLPYEDWESMLKEGIDPRWPIIAGERADGTLSIWDGYHRLAITLSRRDDLSVLIGRHRELHG